MQDLTPCISAALAAHATFALDGWASYQGPLSADGKPAFDYAYNRQISKARVKAIANLLVNGLRVPRSAITRLTGHGNLNQPDPGDPSSPANRVVIITYTVKLTNQLKEAERHVPDECHNRPTGPEIRSALAAAFHPEGSRPARHPQEMSTSRPLSYARMAVEEHQLSAPPAIAGSPRAT